jgi:alkylated DNA repair dioxygenase AlkB
VARRKTPELFDAPEVPGLTYKPEVLAAADENRFVARFGQLDFRPFEFHGFLGKRRIVSYGWRYDYGAQRLEQAAPMPDFLAPLRDIAARLSGVPAEAFIHVLIAEYAPGAGIGWHRDKPMFHHVVALSFLSPCRLRFRRLQGTWQRRDVTVAPRSGYVLDGDARALWEHSIPAVEARRYSVTFRDFRPEAK